MDPTAIYTMDQARDLINNADFLRDDRYSSESSEGHDHGAGIIQPRNVAVLQDNANIEQQLELDQALELTSTQAQFVMGVQPPASIQQATSISNYAGYNEGSVIQPTINNGRRRAGLLLQEVPFVP